MPGRKQQAAVTPAKDDGAEQPAVEGTAVPGVVTPEADPAAPDVTAVTPDDGDQGEGSTEGTDPVVPAAPDDGSAPDADPGTPDTPATQETPAVTGGSPAAAPLSPPVPRVTPRTPAPAATEPNAAPRQPDGGHVGYTDHAGNALKHGELFTDPGPQFTFMVTAKRILQTFHFPGQHRDSTRTSAQLVFAEGVKVPRHLAHGLIEAVKADAEGGDKSAIGDGPQDS